MKKLPQQLNQLLNNSGSLPELKEKAELILRLNQLLKQHLRGPIAEQVHVVNLRQNTLILETPSAVWATRLNAQKSQILLTIQNEALPMLTGIDVKVNPRLSTYDANPPIKHAKLSQTSASHIEALAESVEGELGQKLKRLAALASRNRQS
ncbi:DUF721 domain-containing protein [Parashewanella curva]|uniref:DUF721 domain-containing protein n=1 Tax=Parashewanella curva TaxID=2338552 RepID=A0A3L8PU69_9GAMM|nr:DciA family protein [Parashewanella curva]RLV58941.1 DUF721 domain-containing protein [Parashewanella curva]